MINRKLNILLVEDNPVNQAILVKKVLPKAIDTHTLKIDVASSGDKAIEFVQKNSAENYYDLIFLDGQMPGKLGPETLVEIRRLEIENNITKAKVFIYSSETAEWWQDELMKAKKDLPNDFIEHCGFITDSKGSVKNVNVDALKEKLKTHFFESQIMKAQHTSFPPASTGLTFLSVQGAKENNSQLPSDKIIEENLSKLNIK